MAEPLVLEQRTSGITRVACAVAGCIPVMAPVELGPALWPPSVADVVLVPVVAGSVLLTVVLWGVAALGPVQTWTVDADGLREVGTFGRWTRRRHVDADLVREAEVVEDTDDGAPAWSVVVRTGAARPLRFPAGGRREDAEALRRRVLDALGPPPGGAAPAQ